MRPKWATRPPDALIQRLESRLLLSAVNLGSEPELSGSARGTPHPSLSGAQVVAHTAAPDSVGQLTGFSAAAASTSQISLTWNAVSGATSYNIYRGTSSNGENSTPIATGIAGTSFTDIGLDAATTYCYTAAAVDSSGPGAQSAEVSATPMSSDMVVYDDTNSAIVYSQGQNGDGLNGWDTSSDSADFGGGEHSSNAYSGSFVINFLGTDFEWFGDKSPDFGIANLYLDGQLVGTADSYNPTVLNQQVLYSVSGLADGAHCFEAQIGDYPSPAANPAASGWEQAMDAFGTSGTPLTNLPIVSAAYSPVTQTGTWFSDPNDLFGRYAYTNQVGATLNYSFNGSGVDVFGHPEGEDGIMNVYVDGSETATVDEFNPLLDKIEDDANDDQLVYAIDGLPAGNHTIEIQVAPGHDPNAVATGSLVANNPGYYTQIDGFVALPSGLSAPSITTNPQSQSVAIGTPVSFAAAANAYPTPTVQWEFSTDGGGSFGTLTGQTTTALSIGTATAGETGYEYEAVFTNSLGTATTAPATLTVTPAVVPTITTYPLSQSVTAGANVTFTAAAAANPTPTVQWELSTDGGNTFSTIAGATSTTLSFSTVSVLQTGYEYEALFTNPAGVTTTTAATLTVNQPSGGSLTGSVATAAATYNLTALGTSDWAHWGRAGTSGNFDHDASGGSQISNITKVGSGGYGGWTYSARTLSWTNGTPTATDAADHGYIWANNALGAGYSFTVPASTTPRMLFIYLGGSSAGGTFTAQLSDNSANPYSINVSGSSNFQDIVAITYNAGSSTSLTLTYTKTQTIGAASGSVDLIAAWLTGAAVPVGPTVTSNPQSQSVTSGTVVNVTAAASGSPPPAVQWQFSTDGGNSYSSIAGATSATLSLGAATVSESGYEYEAAFTNPSGTAATAPATLTVIPSVAPTIATNPQSQTVTAETSVNFTAAATATPAPTVQWDLSTNGGASFAPISGATATTLSIGAATLGETGYEYEAIFTNSAGTATTTAATLIVTAPTAAPTITTNPLSQSVTVGVGVTFTAAATGTPTPTVQWELSTNGGASFAPISGATATTLSIGAATLGETGYEYEAIFTNPAGATATAAASLTVASPTSIGSLTGSISAAAASYNLTALGAADWAHWGRGGSASNFDHDKAGGSQISKVARLGPGSYGGYTDSVRTVSWTNGTPTASSSGDHGYLWANNALGAGYSFTVPASTAAHTLFIYLGGYSAGGTVTAQLSDGSASPFSVSISGSAKFTDLAAIHFAAGAAGQTLTITYSKTATIGAASGSVDLIAAWLV